MINIWLYMHSVIVLFSCVLTIYLAHFLFPSMPIIVIRDVYLLYNKKKNCRWNDQKLYACSSYLNRSWKSVGDGDGFP